MADETITKKRVTMTNFIPNGLDENGVQLFDKHEAIDYVREDLLPAYLAAVKATNSWQQVLVSEEYDAGPGGYHGPTYVPPALDHPDAGTFFPATPGSDVEDELLAAGDPATHIALGLPVPDLTAVTPAAEVAPAVEASATPEAPAAVATAVEAPAADTATEGV
jgi:hypothetical protein